MYVDGLYLMTTTITTVGYGDFKGFNDTDGEWIREMVYLIFVTVIGIVLFSIITNEIFTYQYPITVKQIVSQKHKDMELYMWTLSAVRKGKALETDMIDTCLKQMEEAILTSTRYYFSNNTFYDELPEKLKRRLVMKVLTKQYSSWQFFFEDMIN